MPGAPTFPVHDWQFWLVSVVALAAVLLILRHVLPGKRRKRAGRSVSITIERKGVDKR